MKYLPIILAGLTRRLPRTVLTFISVSAAFSIFGMTESVNAGFESLLETQRLDRLFTNPRVPGGTPMPVSAISKIAQIPGVVAVAERAIFPGYYQTPKNTVVAMATALLGICIAYVAFNGHVVSTIGGVIGNAQLVYTITISPAVIAIGGVLAIIVGLGGGLLPALRVSRMPVASGLRTQ